MTEKAKVQFVFSVPMLRLPAFNQVLRWNRWQKQREIKRVRDLVMAHAYQQGYVMMKPLPKASVVITARGPYKTDSDGIYYKDAIDAIVARPEYAKIGSRKVKLTTSKGNQVRRWGLIEDDAPINVGDVVFVIIRQPKEYDVHFMVTERTE